MRLTRLFTPIIILLALLAVTSAHAQTVTPVTKQLAPGVTLYQEITTGCPNPLIINAVTVDLAASGVRIRPGLAADYVYTDKYKGRESVSSLTARSGATVGINADYFPWTGDPLGLCVIGGELISEPHGKRVVFCIDKDGKPFFDMPRFKGTLTFPRKISRQIDGINRARITNQLVVYTARHGDETYGKFKGTDLVCASNDLPVKCGKQLNLTVLEVKKDAISTPIPKDRVVISAGGPAGWFLAQNAKPGDSLQMLFEVTSDSGRDWSTITHAAGGGPWLVRDGKKYIDYTDEEFKFTFANLRHPRSAIGVRNDGKILLVTVDGRQSISAGANLNEMAAIMLRLGAKDAINLDGGGSTALSYRGRTINSPSGGVERLVANAFLVFAPKLETDTIDRLTINSPLVDVTTEQGANIFLTWGEDAQLLSETQSEGIIWAKYGKNGFVDQTGFLHPLSEGNVTAYAFNGTQVLSLAVDILPPPDEDEEETANGTGPVKDENTGTTQPSKDNDATPGSKDSQDANAADASSKNNKQKEVAPK